MAEPIVQEPLVQATLTTPAVESVTSTTPPEPDLMSKISNFRKNAPAKSSTDNPEFFDFKEIENIQDPVAKEVAMKAYKSMQSGLTKKTQDLAEQRKGYEAKLVEMQNWSPERIQRELLNNPQFLQAAQQITGNVSIQNPQNSGLTDEQYSALTDREKSEFSAIKSQNSVLANEINTLKQVNFQTSVIQHDANLRTKFPDYNSVEIDTAIKNLAQLNPLDIREHVYKSLHHDQDVKDAYELGRSESRQLNQEKISAFAPNGMSSVASDGVPVKAKGETDLGFFQRIAQFRLAQSRKR